MSSSLLLLLAFVGAQPIVPIKHDDEVLLRNSDLPTAPTALVDFLRRQKVDDTLRETIGQRIIDLGANDFPKRQSATEELIRLGPTALPALEQARKSPDLEVARRADICRQAINNVSGPIFQKAVVRLLAKKAPATAVPVLLASLPDLRSEDVDLVVIETLARIGVKDGRPTSALVAAQRDGVALRRAVAGAAIARAGDADARGTAIAQLADPEPFVRMRIALALLDRGEPAALPVLIRLLGELPLDQAYAVENALVVVAGGSAPGEWFDARPASRKQAVAAWQEWHAATGAKLDLAHVMTEANRPRPMLLVLRTVDPNECKVIAVNEKGQVIWKVAAARSSCCVQKLPGDRFLLTEYTTEQVTEQNSRGEVGGTLTVKGHPIEAIRQADGNTQIATRQGLRIVDAQGKVLRAIPFRVGGAYAMTPMHRGEIGVVAAATRFHRLDANGKELASFTLPGRMYSSCGHFAVSPGGNRITIPLYRLNARAGRLANQPGLVIQYDPNGKIIWQTPADRPTSVRRLANGHFLVASWYHSTLLELDGRGKVVNQYQVPNEARILDARR